MLKNNKKFWFSVCFAFMFSVCLAMPSFAHGASLYLSPSVGVYEVGDTFSVKVKVNSKGKAINSAEGIVKFNVNQLSVKSVSKSGSIFSLWVKEPAFSNSKGTVKFTGGRTSGFTGTSGTIFTITFKAKTIATSKVNFSSGSVLAADGKGTNVLSSMSSGVYTLKPAVVAPPAEEYIPPSPKNTPSAAVISSITHPNSEKWYSNNDPEFTWKIPDGITGVKLLYNKHPKTAPAVFYSSPIYEKQLEDLADGIWYFHVQLRNKSGWGKISHFKFQIDAESPKPFEIIAQEGEETTNPQPTLLFETTDDVSGIDYYEIIIDKENPIITQDTEYKIPLQTLGRHNIIVKAVDRAENQMLAMAEINILPIETPIITDYPKELLPGNILSIKGAALPEATIKVSIQRDKKEVKIGETKSDKEGKWTYIEVEPLEKGVYQVWAQSIDSLGSQSEFSEKVTILVSPPVFIKIGKLAIDYLTTIITLLVLIAVIIFGVIWSWQKIKKRRRRLKKEISEAEKTLYQAFKTLKEETERQVAKLDKKPGLSEREKKISDDLKKALKISEKFISKKIKDVIKEL